MIHAYGTLRALMDHRPEFSLFLCGSHIFLGNQDIEIHEWPLHDQKKPIPGGYLPGPRDGGSRHAIVGEPERERCSSSSSSYYESAIEELSEEEKHEPKDAYCQQLLSLYRSRGL